MLPLRPALFYNFGSLMFMMSIGKTFAMQHPVGEHKSTEPPVSSFVEYAAAQLSFAPNNINVGSGSFGNVRRVRRISDGSLWAWKTPGKAAANSRHVLARELKLLMLMTLRPHMNLMWVLGTWNGGLLLPLGQHGDFGTFVEANEDLALTLLIPGIWFLILGAMRGLHYAADVLGISHRDLKRDQLLVFSTTRPFNPLSVDSWWWFPGSILGGVLKCVVADFGSGKDMHQRAKKAAVDTPGISHRQSEPPEYRLSKQKYNTVDLYAADIFMLGLAVYSLRHPSFKDLMTNTECGTSDGSAPILAANPALGFENRYPGTFNPLLVILDSWNFHGLESRQSARGCLPFLQAVEKSALESMLMINPRDRRFLLDEISQAFAPSLKFMDHVDGLSTQKQCAMHKLLTSVQFADDSANHFRFAEQPGQNTPRENEIFPPSFLPIVQGARTIVQQGGTLTNQKKKFQKHIDSLTIMPPAIGAPAPLVIAAKQGGAEGKGKGKGKAKGRKGKGKKGK